MPALDLLSKGNAMTTNRSRDRNRPSIGHIVLTIGIVCGALGTTLLVSSALKAVEHVDRVNNTLAELSHYIADGHASIRGPVSAPGSPSDDALEHFNRGVERRVAQFRNLKTDLEQQASAYLWTQLLLGNTDVFRVDEERRAYVTAAVAAATTPARDRGVSLRTLDLRAQKLIQTVEALRDSTDMARGRALIAVDGIVALSSGVGVLLIVYLMWHPLLGGARHSAGTALLGKAIGTPSIPFTQRQRTGWPPRQIAVTNPAPAFDWLKARPAASAGTIIPILPPASVTRRTAHRP